jgi:hypothetical protein
MRMKTDIVGNLYRISQSLRCVAKYRPVPENIMSNVLIHNFLYVGAV